MSEHDEVTIVMLSARTEEVDRIVGFELGVDDYISNQFALSNLAALVTLFKNAGAITPSQATTIIGNIVLSWLTKVGVPAGSGVVRIAS